MDVHTDYTGMMQNQHRSTLVRESPITWLLLHWFHQKLEQSSINLVSPASNKRRLACETEEG